MFFKKKIVDFSDAVVLGLENKDKFCAINEVVQRAKVFQKLKRKEEFINAIFQREIEKTTGFGHGVAVAHGKIMAASSIKIALGISKEGISYDATDGQPVHLLFVVASSPNKSKKYLALLSLLMGLVRDEVVREALLNAKSVEMAEAILHAHTPHFLI